MFFNRRREEEERNKFYRNLAIAGALGLGGLMLLGGGGGGRKAVTAAASTPAIGATTAGGSAVGAGGTGFTGGAPPVPKPPNPPPLAPRDNQPYLKQTRFVARRLGDTGLKPLLEVEAISIDDKGKTPIKAVVPEKTAIDVPHDEFINRKRLIVDERLNLIGGKNPAAIKEIPDTGHSRIIKNIPDRIKIRRLAEKRILGALQNTPEFIKKGSTAVDTGIENITNLSSEEIKSNIQNIRTNVDNLRQAIVNKYNALSDSQKRKLGLQLGLSDPDEIIKEMQGLRNIASNLQSENLFSRLGAVIKASQRAGNNKERVDLNEVIGFVGLSKTTPELPTNDPDYPLVRLLDTYGENQSQLEKLLKYEAQKKRDNLGIYLLDKLEKQFRGKYTADFLRAVRNDPQAAALLQDYLGRNIEDIRLKDIQEVFDTHLKELKDTFKQDSIGEIKRIDQIPDKIPARKGALGDAARRKMIEVLQELDTNVAIRDPSQVTTTPVDYFKLEDGTLKRTVADKIAEIAEEARNNNGIVDPEKLNFIQRVIKEGLIGYEDLDLRMLPPQARRQVAKAIKLRSEAVRNLEVAQAAADAKEGFRNLLASQLNQGKLGEGESMPGVDRVVDEILADTVDITVSGKDIIAEAKGRLKNLEEQRRIQALRQRNQQLGLGEVTEEQINQVKIGTTKEEINEAIERYVRENTDQANNELKEFLKEQIRNKIKKDILPGSVVLRGPNLPVQGSGSNAPTAPLLDQVVEKLLNDDNFNNEITGVLNNNNITLEQKLQYLQDFYQKRLIWVLPALYNLDTDKVNELLQVVKDGAVNDALQQKFGRTRVIIDTFGDFPKGSNKRTNPLERIYFGIKDNRQNLRLLRQEIQQGLRPDGFHKDFHPEYLPFYVQNYSLGAIDPAVEYIQSLRTDWPKGTAFARELGYGNTPQDLTLDSLKLPAGNFSDKPSAFSPAGLSKEQTSPDAQKSPSKAAAIAGTFFSYIGEELGIKNLPKKAKNAIQAAAKSIALGTLEEANKDLVFVQNMLPKEAQSGFEQFRLRVLGSMQDNIIHGGTPEMPFLLERKVGDNNLHYLRYNDKFYPIVGGYFQDKLGGTGALFSSTSPDQLTSFTSNEVKGKKTNSQKIEELNKKPVSLLGLSARKGKFGNYKFAS